MLPELSLEPLQVPAAVQIVLPPAAPPLRQRAV